MFLHKTGRELDLVVVEYLEREPAAYIQEDGYLCTDSRDEVEFFVALDGRVDCKVQDQWIMGIGVCPKLKDEMDLMTAALDGVMGDYERKLRETHGP